MNSHQKKVLKQVCGAHVSVVFLLLFIPWIKGCFRPRPKEIITFIDLAASSSSVPDVTPEPEPAPAVIPKPEPKPEPKPKPIPKPVITNPPPKVVKAKPKPPPKKTTPKPTPKPPPKKATPAPKPAPKLTEAERLAAIRQNNPVTTTPSTKPASKLDFSGIKSALNSVTKGAAPGSGSGAGGGVYSPFAGYYRKVQDQMDLVWKQPSGAPIGLTAQATVRVEHDGRVSAKSITRRSGNAVFDQSVQSALNATTHLPVPPADLPDRNISIDFALRSN